MRVFVTLLALFMIGSMVGYVIEVFFRRFFSKPYIWKNPGFLTGPYLPLYGTGTIMLFFICVIPMHFFWKVLLFAFALTLVEYIAGVIFIERMKIKLWDYSNLWGNYKGIICPLFTFLWTILGVAFYLFLYPILSVAVDYILVSPNLYLLIGLFYGIFICDFSRSMNLVAKIKAQIDETREAVAFEQLKLSMKKRARENGFRSHYYDLMKEEGILEHFVKLEGALKSLSLNKDKIEKEWHKSNKAEKGGKSHKNGLK